MNWEGIKAKLTSRKFWMMVITFIGLICVALNVEALTTEKIIGVISSFSILVIYMIGETFTDIANRKLNVGEVVVVNVALKLTSRKFWAALVSFITTLLITLGVDILTVDHIETMIMAIATVAIYILGESAVDVSKIRAELQASKQEIKEETENLTDYVKDQITPCELSNWMPMYIFAYNKIAADVYCRPELGADNWCSTLPHLTPIEMEDGVSYGTNGDFVKIRVKGSEREYFIKTNEVVRAYANADTPLEEGVGAEELETEVPEEITE